MPQTKSHLGSDTGAPWWKGAIVCQIYPRSFLDSDGGGTGNLVGITAGLDHIALLGVDAIWLSPFFVLPIEDYGYEVADYCESARRATAASGF
jgi:alpha-glucosidase